MSKQEINNWRLIMIKRFVILTAFVLMFVACQASGGEGATTAVSGRLTMDYADALPVQSQLILGTLNLEGTEQAVDEAEAAELLPLWQAVQSLGQSDTTAEAEITAVLNQIQDTMSDEQIAAIAAMQLTADDVQTIMQEQGFRFGPRGNNGVEGEQGQDRGGFGGFAAPPGGGPPSGGPPGGGQFGGPGGLANLSEDERATRLAERFGNGDATSQFLVNPLIALLQVKTGIEVDAGSFGGRGFGGPFMDVISQATGLSVEEIQAQTADGKTLAEIISENGGNLEAIRSQLIEQFNDFPNAQENDVEQQVDNLLNGTFTSPQP